jgi:long-chain fatty acid transport protein
MKRSFVVLLAAAAMLALAAGPVMAGAFRIPEAGAKAMGFGNAFVGMADDPSAVQFNPAGMTQLEGNQILVGVTSVTTDNSYADTSGTKSDAEAGSFLPPHFFYTNHLEDLGDGNWWLGLGVVAPFGLGTEWEVSTFDFFATKTELELVKINPAMAYKLNDNVSLGFGLDYYHVMSLIYANNTDVPISGTQRMWMEQELSGDGDSYGFNVAAHYTASDQLRVGFAYRSGTDLDVDGDVSLGGTKAGSGSTTLKLPATAALGVAFVPADKWSVNLDLDWTGWSSYDELVIDAVIGGMPVVIPQAKDYDDTIAYRIGAQYQLNDTWALRAGYLMEKSPIPEDTYEPRLPGGDRTGFSVGTGYAVGPWTADFAYMLVNIDKYTVNTGATYDPDTQSPYAGMNWPFGQPPVQTVDGEYEGDIILIALSVGYAL